MNSIINRSVAPSSEELNNFKIIEGNIISISNNIDLHIINAGTSDIIKLDIICDGGVRNQKKNPIAAATSALLREGTNTKTALQIADELDFYGAYLQTHCTADDSIINLFCLKKHFDSCLSYVLDIICNSYFPDNEINIYKNNSIQRLLVNKQRNSFLVRRLFYSSIFGPISPYGIYSESDDYTNFSRENLLEFFDENYKNKVKYIVLSGEIDNSIINCCETFFCDLKNNSKSIKPITKSGKINDLQFFDRNGAVQSAIRIGRRIVNRTHIDYRKLQILNLILGGYFGSRLMKNIREEKGLTYGIYSVLESFIDDGCFFIETEINNDLREKGLKEIYLELKKLREILISEEELILAKNYLLGSFLRSIDGPFSLADRHKILVDYGLDYNYYYEYINIIKNIKAKEIRELANTYLQEKDLSEIIVGSK